jgi:hypothetical protein
MATKDGFVLISGNKYHQYPLGPEKPATCVACGHAIVFRRRGTRYYQDHHCPPRFSRHTGDYIRRASRGTGEAERLSTGLAMMEAIGE